MDRKHELVRRLETASIGLGPKQNGVLYGSPPWGELSPAVALWRILYKRRRAAIVTAAVLVSAVMGATLLQTPVFRARALLEFQNEHNGVPTLRDALELGGLSSAYLETQYKLLRSESLARRVIDELTLEEREEFNDGRLRDGGRIGSSGPSLAPVRASTRAESRRGSLAEDAPEIYERVLGQFQRRLHVDPVINSRLVEVSFESEDTRLAAAAVDSLINNYLSQSLEAGRSATRWLSNELERVRQRLEESEADLHDYARRNGLFFVEEGAEGSSNMASQRLRRLQEELTTAQAARFEKEALYRLVQTGEVSALPGVFENKLMQDLTLRLAELKREEAQLAAVFDRRYPTLLQIRSQIEKLESLLEEERSRAGARIVNEYNAAVRQERLVRDTFEEELSVVDASAKHRARYGILKREVETQRQIHDSLLQRLREAGVSAGLDAASIRVVDRPRPPIAPSRPLPWLNLALAIVGGLGSGIGAALLKEYLDSSIDNPEDVERLFHVPALGLIPSIDTAETTAIGSGRVIDQVKLLAKRARSHSRPSPGNAPEPDQWYRIDEAEGHQNVLSEAFRNLRTSVLMPSSRFPVRSLLVTSSEPGEGKTTIASNLAIAVAQLGKRVLLIDADLRSPSLHRAFHLEAAPGLADYLAGGRDWKQVRLSTDARGLDLILAGGSRSGSAELLSASRMRMLVEEALESYDFVVVDSPPLLDIADSRILATVVDGVMLVVKGNATPRELVHRAALGTLGVGARIIGIVLNQVKPTTRRYYYRMDEHSAGTS